MEDPIQVVRKGYDAVSRNYRGDQADASLDPYLDWVSPILKAGKTSRVLDLGCGNGIPIAKYLSDLGYAVTGVDISETQIERARSLVPRATFLCQDVTTLTFKNESFSAVTAFYSIIHIPVAHHKQIFANIFNWLQPGGYFISTLGADAWTGWEKDWLGVKGAEMYWSHADRDTNFKWLKEIGFEVIEERFIPEGDSRHQLFIARKLEE